MTDHFLKLLEDCPYWWPQTESSQEPSWSRKPLDVDSCAQDPWHKITDCYFIICTPQLSVLLPIFYPLIHLSLHFTVLFIIPISNIAVCILILSWYDLVWLSCCCCCLVARSCPTLLWPHELYSSRLLCPHEISQARTLEWVAVSSSRGYSRPRDQTCISCTF